ncbi:myocyte-specific enhancer factor 2 isoform X2 [Eurytemora carolleeae]|uniref:myocyte-specific enhancer factor 2 isoform X2 n=1 Tax=Eurytemora carolleeae TaxID=1294199 RepID=UPI000C76487F|nr:myocyte-specific enhancer factor 2 isoform X2 [Eurytemora carolleeae]|eukprot:XP_023349466.1 myocyte-specific enhancer factor 2-like isoform X2 [Eurytemora affinis]
MVSAELGDMMQTAGSQDPLSQESYLRSMAAYPHPDSLPLPPHHHSQMQVYDDEVDEKSGSNMNMGPRTWYQVPPRDLRYPEDPHLQYGLPPMVGNMKRSVDAGQMDMMDGQDSSDEDSQDTKPMIHPHDEYPTGGAGRGKPAPSTPLQGKKTKGRVKIKMEFIDNKLRRYTTFSKRKTGIMKKAYELSTLTGTQVMLLVASETGHVYTFATRKLQPMITSDTGKALIQTCLNSPDPPPIPASSADQRMSATGYEETELTYNVNEDEQQKVRQMMYSSHYSHPQHSHNLFSPSPSQYPVSHSYITPHPAPSPSPSHHHPYGVSLSPTLSHSPTHHISSPGPPFHHSQHHSVR